MPFVGAPKHNTIGTILVTISGWSVLLIVSATPMQDEACVIFFFFHPVFGVILGEFSDSDTNAQKTLLGRVRVQFAQNEGHEKATKKAQTLFSFPMR